MRQCKCGGSPDPAQPCICDLRSPLQRMRHERDSARAWTHYLAGACVALLLGLLYFALKGPGMPHALSCPNQREVMHLDPTRIQSPALETVEL